MRRVHLESVLDYWDNCSVHNPQFGRPATDRTSDAGSSSDGELLMLASL